MTLETVDMASIGAMRPRLGDRIHHTPMLSSATAARFVVAASGVRLGEGRLYLKAEHLQKTGSFKPRAALSRISSLTPDGRSRGGVERLKQVLEPAGSAALAAVLVGAVPLRPGDRVCVILSGGNVAVERVGELIAAAAPLQAAD